MARFRYSMQSILDIKEKMESQARQEFASARTALGREENILSQLQQRREQYELQAIEMQQKGKTLDLKQMKESRLAIANMDEKINSQKVRVKAAENQLEVVRNQLTEVIMERKTHEKLKEKAYLAFLEEEKKKEGKSIDELTSYVHGQKEIKRDRSSVMV